MKMHARGEFQLGRHTNQPTNHPTNKPNNQLTNITVRGLSRKSYSTVQNIYGFYGTESFTTVFQKNRHWTAF